MWYRKPQQVEIPAESLAHAKRNLRFENIEQICKTTKSTELYGEVKQGIATNVKFGPWRATSGLSIPYYLNSSTNFLDKVVAPKIALLYARVLREWLKGAATPENRMLIVGPEVAGGMLACQLASAGIAELNEVCDFIYMRKEAKSTGTQQQLEGPQRYTTRTSKSPVINAIWVDDCISTGSSMVDGVRRLRSEWNINVTHALFLVDRTIDRANLPPQRQALAHPVLEGIDIKAIFDLEQIDQSIPEHLRKAELPPEKPKARSCTVPLVVAAFVVLAIAIKRHA